MTRRHHIILWTGVFVVGLLVAVGILTYPWRKPPDPASAQPVREEIVPPREPKLSDEPKKESTPIMTPPPVAEVEPIPAEAAAAVPERDLRVSETPWLPSEEGDRAARAKERVLEPLRELFAAADAPYPAERLYLRVFKREGELEMWAADKEGAWKLIVTYAVAGASGGPGPKRMEGDGQVPEGFYEIDRFNPKSSYHLSLGLNYPNEADRILGDPQKPGYDIFLHGRTSSIGCLAMGDDRMEEIYVAASDTKRKPIPVHIFPGRMDAKDWNEWCNEVAGGKPAVLALWEQLRVGIEIFETHGVLPKVSVDSEGRYVCAVPARDQPSRQ